MKYKENDQLGVKVRDLGNDRDPVQEEVRVGLPDTVHEKVAVRVLISVADFVKVCETLLESVSE